MKKLLAKSLIFQTKIIKKEIFQIFFVKKRMIQKKSILLLFLLRKKEEEKKKIVQELEVIIKMLKITLEKKIGD